MRALITGITGQDGSYLAELLISKGYEVHGVVRRASNFNTQRIDHIFPSLHLHYGDVLDPASLLSVLLTVEPDEVYNLAAQSHVKTSFEVPAYTADATALGALNLFEAVRQSGMRPKIYQASTSEMFGDGPALQNEETVFSPRSPYAVSKVFAHQMARVYREAYGMHISCGILFNHESPRRGETFVTRKISRAAARIRCGLQSELELGDVTAKRDWGFAGDYVRGMWTMLQVEPDDFVLATGETHSVLEFAEEAFDQLGLNIAKYLRVNTDRYMRPLDVPLLCGDASKARTELGWEPRVTFRGLVKLMVEADLWLAEKEVLK